MKLDGASDKGRTKVFRASRGSNTMCASSPLSSLQELSFTHFGWEAPHERNAEEHGESLARTNGVIRASGVLEWRVMSRFCCQA